MKTKVVIGSLLATMITFEVLAQRAENDDMYFNSKDREKMKGESSVHDKSANDKIDSDYNAFRKKHFDKNEPETVAVNETGNPTDSYSARTTNPEYISRSNAQQASEDEQNYYIEGYAPANVYDSYSASGNNNYANNYNNSNYGQYGYGSPYNSYYSPYSGSYNQWMNPYSTAASGLTFSLGYMWGSPGWNYGMSYGYGSAYNPYSYYPSYYSPYYSGYGYGNGYGYPTYYGSADASRTNYGKRPSRHSAIVTPTPRSYERVTSTTNTNGGSNGRTRQPVEEYYVKPFKRTTPIDQYINSATQGARDRYVRPSTSDYPASRTRDSYNSSHSSSPSYSTPSRSSSSGYSMPSRSSSGYSGGSSSPSPRKRD